MLSEASGERSRLGRVRRGTQQNRNHDELTLPRTRWSWAWKDSVHVQAKGRWLGKEVVLELSEMYRALSATDNILGKPRAGGSRLKNNRRATLLAQKRNDEAL